jgi:isopenicillin-N epimerase
VDGLGAAIVFGTLHKWLPVPRPAGFLHADATHVDRLRPAEVSNSYDETTLAGRFSWRGTYDPANLLVLPDAIDTWRAWDDSGAHRLARRLSTQVADALTSHGWEPTGPESMAPPRMRAHLVPGSAPPEALREHLRGAGVHAWVGVDPHGRTVLRHATHACTRPDDAGRLLDALRSAPTG